MPRKEERSPFDLGDLQRIMDSGTGPAEIPDTTPVLRADSSTGYNGTSPLSTGRTPS